jgi:lycopene cyclase domain-containing protein
VAAVLGVLTAVVLDLFVLRTALLRLRSFWVAYAIVLGFQLLTNGVLTGREVVRYDPTTILGLRVAFAPIEDLLFGFSLVLRPSPGGTSGAGAQPDSRAGTATRRRLPGPTDTRRVSTGKSAFSISSRIPAYRVRAVSTQGRAAGESSRMPCAAMA